MEVKTEQIEPQGFWCAITSPFGWGLFIGICLKFLFLMVKQSESKDNERTTKRTELNRNYE